MAWRVTCARAPRAQRLVVPVLAVLGLLSGPRAQEARTRSVTLWTQRGELFMEYQVPVAGRAARFTAHLTEASRWQPVVRAVVTLRLARGAGPVLVGKADRAVRPGIFQPILELPEPGSYRGELSVDGPDLTERFPLAAVLVQAPGEAPPAEEEASTRGEVVSFLKEQQWKIPFRIVEARRRRLAHAVLALGEIKPRPGHSWQIGSPVDGRVVSGVPVVGSRVGVGDLLVEISPFLAPDIDRPHLDSEVIQAEAELAKAHRDLARIEGLFGKGVMARKELDAARTQATIGRAKLRSAHEHRQAYLAAQQTRATTAVATQHFQVRAPIGGQISAVHVSQGQQVGRDRLLLQLDDLSRVWVEVRVFEPDLPAVRRATGAVFHLPGFDEPFALERLGGRVVHVGRHIEASSRTAPVLFEVSNPDEAFPIGGSVEAEILTGQSGEYLVVPAEGVVDDGGRSLVFVQVEGEAFERREVVTGLVDRGLVAILRGLAAGERVVTTGSYEIRLSTMTGTIPEHGHTH